MQTVLYLLLTCGATLAQQVPPRSCCINCPTTVLPFNATVTIASRTCGVGEVAVADGITLDANGTMVARITSDAANWYDNYHGGFGMRESALYALTCFNEPNLRGAVERTIYVIAQCLARGGCTVQHRENFKCEKAPPLSKCTCTDCRNQVTLRGRDDQEVLAHLACPKVGDVVILSRMNAATTKANQVFNLIVQENPDSDTFFPSASVLSASCGSISELKLTGVREAYVVAQCLTQECNLDWNVSLRCESLPAPAPSCACADCTSSLRLNMGESRTFTTECPKEVGVSALNFVTSNQGFRVSTNNASWLSSPASALTTCFFSPKSAIWTGQRKLQTKVECLDAKGCDFLYKMSTVCECACTECRDTAVVLPRGEKKTWTPQVCPVGEIPVLNTLRISSADGVFTVTGLLTKNQSLIDPLTGPGRTSCFDAYLEKPFKMVDSVIEAKCLTQQCSLQSNVTFACQPANSFVFAVANSNQCLTLNGNALGVSPCDPSSVSQQFTVSLTNPDAKAGVGKAFFLGKAVTLRPVSSPSRCVSPLGRVQANCAPLRATGTNRALNLGGQGKAGGCLVAQNSGIVNAACPSSFAWSIFATISV